MRRRNRERGGGWWRRRRRVWSYPGVPVLSWGSAWLPLLCCSLSQRHDCIPLFTHCSSRTQHLSQPRPLHPLSASLSLIPAFSCSLISHAHLWALHHAPSSSSPLPLHLFLRLCPTSLPDCCSFIPKAQPTPSLSPSVSLPSAAHSQYQFLTFYKYVWLCVPSFVTHFFEVFTAPPSCSQQLSHEPAAAFQITKYTQMFNVPILISLMTLREYQNTINTWKRLCKPHGCLILF